MIEYKDCPECGATKIRATMRYCESCEVHVRHVQPAIERAEKAEARVSELEEVARALLKGTNDWHLEDCNAYGATDDDVQDDPASPDPYCDCGMTAERRRARDVLGRTGHSVGHDTEQEKKTCP